MKPVRKDIDDHITKQALAVYIKITSQHSDKFIELVKLRHKGKMGNVRGDDFIHPAVIHFRGMANRVS